MKNRFTLLCLLLFALTGYAGQSVLGRDGIQAALLSPDGEHIALLNRSGDVDLLLIVSVANKNTAYSRKSKVPQRIQSVAWVDDQRIALQLAEDVKYQLEPQSTGEIEVLEITGDSMRIGGANGGESAVQKALAGRRLALGDGLSSKPGAFLVADRGDRGLWRIDLASDSIEPLDYPPFQLTRLSVSPNTKYMAAEGINDAGENRVMLWSDMGDQSWRELHGTPRIVAVDDSGVAFATLDVDSVVEGLVAVAIETGATTVLFQHESFAVDQVMVDSSNRPFAARYVPGLPGWSYLDNAKRLTQLHKSFLAAMPNSDISFVSSSIDGRRIIAKRMDDDYPSSYFIVDTISGQADRLVDSRSALSIIGGDEDDNYELRSVSFESKTGSEVSGYISLPLEGSSKAKPSVVMLRGVSDESRWQWGFDEDTWFFHRQGLNVLMLNGSPAARSDASPPATSLMARVSDVADAIHGLMQEDFADESQLCLFGRGTGAELALLIALRSDTFDCAISFGGVFGNPDFVVETAQDKMLENRRLHVLLIYGTGDSSSQLASQEKIHTSLASLDIAVDAMPVVGERQLFSSRQNEVRALAKISSFLSDNLVRKNTWPTLPLTYEQALVMNDLHEAIIEHSEEGDFDTRKWRQWFDANDEEARKLLFAEQLSLYESYQKEIIELAERHVGSNFVRHIPIRKKTGHRAEGRR